MTVTDHPVSWPCTNTELCPLISNCVLVYQTHSFFMHILQCFANLSSVQMEVCSIIVQTTSLKVHFSLFSSVIPVPAVKRSPLLPQQKSSSQVSTLGVDYHSVYCKSSLRSKCFCRLFYTFEAPFCFLATQKLG